MKNNKPLLCLIDDDKIYHLLATKIIEKVNPQQEVIAFTNGKQAIDYFVNHNHPSQLPDIILLDINMPVMNGWEFLDAFSTMVVNKQITIYMVSSSVDHEDALRSRQYAIVKDFIVKPLCPDQMSVLLKQDEKLGVN